MEPQKKHCEIKKEERIASYDGSIGPSDERKEGLYLKWLNSKSEDERNEKKHQKKDEVRRSVNVEKNMMLDKKCRDNYLYRRKTKDLGMEI